MAAHLRSALRIAALAVIASSVSVSPAFAQKAPASAEATARQAHVSKDVEQQMKRGGADATSVILPVSAADAQAIAARHDGRVKKLLRHGAVLEVPAYALSSLAEDPSVPQISGDAKVRRMMAVSAVATGADQVWAGVGGLPGYTGRSVGVAVIDSGIANHHALHGRVTLALDFTGGKKGDDEFGHGTHVAGIIAGSPEAGYPGMAPGAHIVSLKALGADGSGDTSDVIAALDWVVENHARYGIRVVNLSLGRPVFESYKTDPLCQAAQRAVDAGLVVVASAGNFGKTADGTKVVGGIVAPGNTPAVITVGALNTKGTPQPSDDVMATYSSRGPTHIDRVLKPELVAPGNRVVSASAHGSAIAAMFPERVVLGQGNHEYIEMSGTSMSAAVVSGAAALLLEAQPGLSPGDVKLALQLTSNRVANTGLVESGAGTLNSLAAIHLIEQPNVLTTATIGGESTYCWGIAFNSTESLRFELTPHILVWGSIVPAEANILVWGNSLASGNALVWGADEMSANILVWGNTVRGEILVWGNILVWGSHHTDANILVWGNSGLVDAD